MKVETQEALVQEFPCLFRNGMFFECGPGWTQLIRDLCSRLEPICLQQREAGEEFVLVAGQVKSKYGGLRFYVDGGTAESDDLIYQAELRSEHICEACGDNQPAGSSPGVGCGCGQFISTHVGNSRCQMLDSPPTGSSPRARGTGPGA